MNSQNALVPAICAVAGITVGFIGGFIFAKAKYKKLYEDKYEKDIYDFKKKEAKNSVEPHKTTEEEAKKIAEEFPTELWTESFKKDQEKRKDYKNLVRDNGYLPDEEGNEIDKSEIFDSKKFDKANRSKCQQEFDDKLTMFSEYSGISKEALLQGEVRIIPEEEYYESTHDSNPSELQWSLRDNVLRDIDGNILEPEITLGDDWDIIIRRIEERPDAETWVYDERLEEYYCISVAKS